MAHEFFNASPYNGVEFDFKAVNHIVTNLIATGGLFVTDHGFIAGLLSPLFFSPSVTIATELAWWSSESGEGESLREAFENWALSQGASAVQMSTLNNSFASRLAGALTENGYTPVEVAYLKAI